MSQARPPQVVNLRLKDGGLVAWDMANEPKPDSVGNGSRNGFLWNCYTHPLGRFFQNTIKWGIISTIRRVHDKEIPRYDREAYTYDDPRLKMLDSGIASLIEQTYVDFGESDEQYKRDILTNLKDIFLFILKEDIYYRPRILKNMVEMAHFIVENEHLFELTDDEKANLERFR